MSGTITVSDESSQLLLHVTQLDLHTVRYELKCRYEIMFYIVLPRGVR